MLVLPSVTPEPFGRTVVEAMAAGCPPVATAAGGPLESVEDGLSGLLVPPDDAEALAGAISRLLADPALARQLGRAGRRRALEHFSLQTMTTTMSTLLRQAAGRPCN
jgi:glycosyltransferase involved in cell wall biosynthesis